MAKGERTLVSFDWAMKSILKQPQHFDVLEGFLAALLGDPDIKVLEILESEGIQKDEEDMFNRVDLKAKDGTGRVIIIELQYKSETNYFSRVYYGVSKTVSEYMRLSRAYGDVPKVISISIVYFDFMKGRYAVKSEMSFRDLSSGESVQTEKADVFAEYYFIQPKRFNDVIKTDLDEWVYMLKHSAIKEGSKSKNIERASEALDFAKMSPEAQSDYDYYWNISKRSAINVLDAAKKEGIEEGRAEGRAEGEKNNAIEMAKRMIIDSEPTEKIMKYTGLTEKEISDIEKR